MDTFNFALSVEYLAEGVFWILLIVFVLHAFFLGYHWFTFGTNKQLSTTALAIYLSGGAILFLTLSLALRAL